MSTTTEDENKVLPDAAPSSSSNATAAANDEEPSFGTKRKSLEEGSSADNVIAISDNENTPPPSSKRAKAAIKKPETIEECYDALEKLEDGDCVSIALDKIAEEIRSAHGKEFLLKFVSLGGGIQSTIRAMEKFLDFQGVQSYGLRVFTGAMKTIESFGEAIVEAGALTRSTKAMEKFPNDATILGHSCALLMLVWDAKSSLGSSKQLVESSKSMIPFLGHALTNKDWEVNPSWDPAIVITRHLWRISKSAQGQKMLIAEGMHQKLDEILMKTSNKELKQNCIVLRLSVMQGHYGFVPGHYTRLSSDEL